MRSFSMANLAKLAGVAKGTLYLYFATREEVFLALYGQALCAGAMFSSTACTRR